MNKKNILMLIIGILVGAIITTVIFIGIDNSKEQNKDFGQFNPGQMGEMPDDSNRPDSKPDKNNGQDFKPNSTNSNT